MKTLLLTISVILLSGCSTKVTDWYLPEQIMVDTNQSKKPYITPEGKVDLSKINFEDYDKEANTSKKMEIISTLIHMSDQECTLHKAGILATSNAWNMGTGGISMLFSGIASVNNHAQTAAELAAGASTLTGIQSLGNQEVYAEKLATTIIRSIDVARAKKKALIDKGIKESEKYTLWQAINDIQAYHNSCSLMEGMIEVTKSLDNRKRSRNELERDIKNLTDALADVNSTFQHVSDQNLTNRIAARYAEEISKLTLQLINTKQDQ